MYFFRVTVDGDSWVCKRGSRIIQRCATVDAGVAIAETEASVYRPSQVLLTHEDGHIEVVGHYAALDY